MQEISSLVFLLPYLLLVIALIVVTIYFTCVDFMLSYKDRNYLRLAYLVSLTVIAFIVGWIAG